MKRIAATALTFVCLWVVYGALERAFPARRVRRFREPDFLTDTCFFFGQYLVFSTAAVALLAQVHAALSAVTPLGLPTVVRAAPAWTVATVAVVLGDALVYGFHRACHRFDVLWRFHAVHHSSERLDWLAAHREHPVDGMLTQLAQNLPAMLLGVPFEILAVLVAFRGAWSILIHSNVRLPLGPLSLLFGAPELHHFHHARVERTAYNFGNLAPWLDVVFGTYRRPAAHETYELGLCEPWPKNYFALLARPLSPRRDEGPTRGTPVPVNNERRWGLRSERSVALLGLIATLGCGSSSPAPVAPAPAPVVPAPIVPATAPTVPGSAPSASPDVDGECQHEREKDRELIPAPCSGACRSFRIMPRRCENGHWRKLAPIEPKCACAPESVPASLRECQVRTILLTPSDEGASDGVTMKLTCGNTLLDVECDGENDGTGTSLCSCHRDGKERRIAGDPWPGEGITVAYRVAERCLSAK